MRRAAKSGARAGKATILAVALVGCAAPGVTVLQEDAASVPPQLSGAPGAGKAAQAPSIFTVGGGVPLRRVSALRYSNASDLPPVQSAEEYAALTELATKLLARAKQARDRKDVDSFWTYYYPAQKLAAHLLAVSSASDTVLRNMQDSGDGKIVSVIPAGSQVLLPTSRAVGPVPVSLPPPQLDAAPVGKPLTINNLLGIGARLANPAQAATTADGLDALRELPDSVPVVLPNGVTAVRSGEALILSNPTDKQQALPLSDMGYVLPSPDTLAGRDWARIALAISRNKSAYFWNKIQRMNGQTFRCDIVPPGALSCSDGDRKWFASDGGWAQSTAQAEETARAYAVPGSAFRRALDQSVRSMAFYEPFHQRCKSGLSSGKHYADDNELSGELANYVSYSCWQSDNKFGPFTLVHSQQFQLLDNGTMPQTEASRLKDRQVRERLMKWQREKQLVQAIAALVPGLGNADALARCTTRNPDFAPSALLADYVARRSGNQSARDMQAAALVGYQAPIGGLGGTIMDCSAVLIPVVTGVKNSLSVAGASKSWLDAWPRVGEAINRARASTIDRLTASDSAWIQGTKWIGLDGAKLSYKTGVMLGYLNWYAGEVAGSRSPARRTPYADALHTLEK